MILVEDLREHVCGFLVIFLIVQLPPKEVFQCTRIHSLLGNAVVTASSHALWRVFSNKVIWVFGHCWVDTPHVHTFEGDPAVQVCCLLSTVAVTPSHDSDYTEALFSKTVSVKITGFVKIRTEPTSTILCIHTSGCMHTRQSSTLLDSSRKKWTFGSKSLLCQRFRSWETRRNGVEMEKNRDTSSTCDVYVTCLDIRCFL